MYRHLSGKLPIMASNHNKFIPAYWVAASQTPLNFQYFRNSFASGEIRGQQVFTNCFNQRHGETTFTTGAYHTYRNVRMPSPRRKARKQEVGSTNSKVSRNDCKTKETPVKEKCPHNRYEKRKNSFPQSPEQSPRKGDRSRMQSSQKVGASRWYSRSFYDSGVSMRKGYNPYCFQGERYINSSRQDDFHYHKDRRTPIPRSSGKLMRCDDTLMGDRRSNTSTSTVTDVPNDASDINYQLERHWEDIDPPSGLSESRQTVKKQIRVLSYNILSQKLLNLNNYLYKKCNPDILPWQYRWRKLGAEIKEFDADILCLQEVEECHYRDHILNFLESLNYQCNYKRRTGNNANKPDGVLIAFKKQHFKVCEEKKVEYFRGNVSPVNQDNVGIITVLKPVFHESISDRGSYICFVNTHLLYNPKRGDIKLAQLATLFSEVQDVLSKYKRSKIPIVLCGDLNSIPQSYLYKFITKGEIDYEGLESKFVSGQQVGKGSKGRLHHIPWPLLPRFMEVSCNGCMRVNQDCASQDGIEPCSEDRFNLRHSLGPLHSAYSHDKPEASTTQDKGVTVDYIFHSSYECAGKKLSMYPTRRLSLIDPSDLQKVNGIPNAVHPSDHLPIVVDFALVHH